MHRLHNKPRIKNGPQTTGSTIHWASQYDIFTGLLGMGGNHPNSRMVIELANVMPGDIVLDVGCGTGSLTLMAQSYAGPGGKVYGIDAAPEMIEVAKKKASRSGLEVVFDVGLIEKLAFPDATFDIVISRLASMNSSPISPISRRTWKGGMVPHDYCPKSWEAGLSKDRDQITVIAPAFGSQIKTESGL